MNLLKPDEGYQQELNAHIDEAAKTDKVPLPYWRAALAEVSLLHPKVLAESKPVEIGYFNEAWRITAAEPDVTTWTTAKFAASKARSDGKSANVLPFLLIPARLSEVVGHGIKRRAGNIHEGLSVLCIPCLLDRTGCLWPDPDRHPWIPRNLLEPTLESIAIGHLDEYDKFMSNLPEKAVSFGDTLETASKLFEAVTGSSLPSLPPSSYVDEIPPVFATDGYELVSAWHGLLGEQSVPAIHLIKLYDEIISKKQNLPLLDNLRTIIDRPSRPPISIQASEQSYSSTMGHINQKHPLSPTQREAMVELALLGKGQVLAVNGPPGTGKTTLLQSVVAQLWVEAALKESECPLIVVTSTNVKAVENVLKDFAEICAETGHRRWHPYGGGFGLFLASESRESKYPTCTSKSHPYSEYETAEAVESAEEFFLRQASAWFKEEQNSVADVVKTLHVQLKHFAQKLKHIVEARFALYRETGQSVTDNPVISCKQLLARYQSQIDAEESVIHALDQELLACKDEQEAVESVYAESLSMINSSERDWNAYLANSPLWLDLFCLIPVIGKEIRKRRMARDRRFLMSNPLTADRKHRDDGMELCFDDLKKTTMASKTSALEPIIDRLTTIASQKNASIQRRIVSEQALSKIDKVFRHWQDTLNHGYESLLDVPLDRLNDRLDTALRAPMFSMSDWYWSGKWLLEMKGRLKTGEADSKGRARLEAKYRRFAKISPCIVSNLHMAPSFFTAWQGENIPFWNAIDLLIVDEAGQVAPDVGAAMFALAKRALVVGDIYQIEPVWNNGEKTDRANAMKFGLMSNPHDLHYDALAGGGYTPAKGSLMRIANRSCLVQKYNDMRGLMLTEHRRCVPELIGYCNELIYSGRLDPMRPSIERNNRILPAFGYLNVVDQDKKTTGESRHNCKEAESIVRWIKANRMQIVNHYTDQYGEETSLWKLLGVITPFKSQARMIDRLLRTEIPDLMRKDQSLTVGTVHALQGAERTIIIFSPTYGESFKGGAFFDQTHNMLNVAVSRAKDSFLVIGNMAVFDPQKRSRPSGLLAAYLANKGENLALE